MDSFDRVAYSLTNDSFNARRYADLLRRYWFSREATFLQLANEWNVTKQRVDQVNKRMIRLLRLERSKDPDHFQRLFAGLRVPEQLDRETYPTT